MHVPNPQRAILSHAGQPATIWKHGQFVDCPMVPGQSDRCRLLHKFAATGAIPIRAGLVRLPVGRCRSRIVCTSSDQPFSKVW